MAKARSTKRNPPARARKRVLIVTGSRSEFGLLRPVMDAVKKHRGLELRVVVAGEHLLKPALTVREVEKAYRVAARVPMQRAGDRGRVDHAAATARGMQGFASAFKKLKPDWVVVLGDRIEAFAAASAASIAGIAVCHIHGGDRAEGIADEAMRHAITKLSHLHCAATKLSAKRIVQMGERKEYVHVTGSPAIDGLRSVRPMSDAEARRIGDPWIVVLMHPSGLTAKTELSLAREVALDVQILAPVLFLAPNADAGRDPIDRTWRDVTNSNPYAHYLQHLPRKTFLSLLARLARKSPISAVSGMLVGNSSAGLIEAAALRVPAVNIGPRQAGRERAGNVVDVPIDIETFSSPQGGLRLFARLQHVFMKKFDSKRPPAKHPFGDGHAGPRIAALLAKTDPHDPALLRKRNSY